MSYDLHARMMNNLSRIVPMNDLPDSSVEFNSGRQDQRSSNRRLKQNKLHYAQPPAPPEQRQPRNHQVGGRRKTIAAVLGLPIQIPGFLVRHENTNSAIYHFPTDGIGISKIFGRQAPYSDLFAGQLQIDLGCVSFLESEAEIVASLFNEVFSQAEKFGLLSFTIGKYRESPGAEKSPENGETPASPRTAFVHAKPEGPESQQRYLQLLQLCQIFKYRCRKEIKEFFDNNCNSNLPATVPTIIVRRFHTPVGTTTVETQCPGTSFMAEAPIQNIDDFALPSVEVSEIRLVFSRGGRESPQSTRRSDPRFPTATVSCRPILMDRNGALARIVFGEPEKLPTVVTRVAAINDAELNRYNEWHSHMITEAIPAARRYLVSQENLAGLEENLNDLTKFESLFVDKVWGRRESASREEDVASFFSLFSGPPSRALQLSRGTPGHYGQADNYYGRPGNNYSGQQTGTPNGFPFKLPGNRPPAEEDALSSSSFPESTKRMIVHDLHKIIGE